MSVENNNQALRKKKQISDRSLTGFCILMAVYAASLTIAGPHGAKLVGLWGLSFDGGLITYSMTFLITDIVSEVYGKTYSRKIVMGSFFGLLVAWLFTQIALSMPASPDWSGAEAFGAVFGVGSRVFLAVMCTFALSQYVDITVFSLVRKWTGEKYLWLRNNLSTLAGGLIDAIVFSSIAFYGTYDLLPIILSAYMIRIVVSLLDTPLVYAGVFLMHKIYPELKR